MYLIARLIHTLFGLYTFGLIVYSLLSWLHIPEAATLSSWLARAYEPLLRPIRQRVRPVMLGGNMIDLSTLILLAAIWMVRSLLISLLIPGF
ncbi:MAG: YggT family protein [Spartobacteria bacterium]|nr:YggT family protein [Spartobacteria bacterium]